MSAFLTCSFAPIGVIAAIGFTLAIIGAFQSLSQPHLGDEDFIEEESYRRVIEKV